MNKPAHIERMIDERTQLETKINSLADFIQGEKFTGLTLHQKSLLCDQIAAMRQYSGILKKRIDNELLMHGK